MSLKSLGEINKKFPEFSQTSELKKPFYDRLRDFMRAFINEFNSEIQKKLK